MTTVFDIPRLRRRRRPFRGDALSTFGLVTLVVLVILGIVGPLLPIGSPTELAGPRLSSPNGEFLLGTDDLGRSLLPRVVAGIRTTFVVSFVAVLVTAVVGTLLGMVAAHAGGVVDTVIMRLADVVFAFPPVVFAVLVVAVMGVGNAGAFAAIVLVTLPLMILVVRSAARTTVDREFVVAARVAGASRTRVLAMHILPNVSNTAIVQATYAVSVAMLVESGMSFLGLGAQPPNSSLGSLVQQGVLYLTTAPWLVLAPGAVLAMAILAVNLLGEGLAALLDTRDTSDVR